MRIKETKVYQFGELSEEAQETAIEKFQDNMQEYFWAEDGISSLKEFCKRFDIELKDYSLDCGGSGNGHIQFNADTYSMIADEMAGMKVYKYILNNYHHILFKPQFRGTIKNDTIKHKRIKHTKLTNYNVFNAYYSGIFRDNCCVLTGYCMDDDILRPIYVFIKKPNQTTTLQDLFEACFDSFISAWNRDVEYQYSEDAIKETIEANEYEFTDDGKMA